MLDIEPVIGRARIAEELGRLEEARRILGEALVAAPNEPRLLQRLADIVYQLERFDDALRYAGMAITANPRSVDAHLTAALAYDARRDHRNAVRHARIAVALDGDGRGLLTLARLLVNAPATDETRAEARSLLERAVEQTPGHVPTLAHAAETYRRLRDRPAVERLIAAGLAVDPTNAGLLRMQARMEFESSEFGGRGRAVATLRGLLGSRPGDRTARLLLAEILWRALLRLVAWAWFYAAAVAVLSMWFGPSVLRFMTPVLFWIIPVAWFRVFRRLRPQLPPGYLWARVRRPAAVLGLVVTVVASLIMDLGAVALRSSTLVTGGYLLLIIGVLGAAVAHLLLMLAWLRRRGDEDDRDAAYEYAFDGLGLALGLGLVLTGLLAALRHWSREPAAFWAFAAICCVAGATMLVEMLIIGLLDWGDWVRPVAHVVTLAVVLGLVVLGFRWSAGHLIADLGDDPAVAARRYPPPELPRLFALPPTGG
ncbi:lipopolysaccharide assembly protein LapB [Nocardia sp. JCM 34519.1]|uniref:tetratricopeptide repeat protein n=1 Tax=Nocardia sp. JCM 34519.1 TaxID=2876119 RepID=UPI001CE410C3|nr:tetratricopeptide repeat protein [Nocardia sp. JCM 34519.1]